MSKGLPAVLEGPGVHTVTRRGPSIQSDGTSCRSIRSISIGDMHREYHRWFAQDLGRDMQLLTFGHAGRPYVVFPTSISAFFEFEDRGMVDALASKLEDGTLQLFC